MDNSTLIVVVVGVVLVAAVLALLVARRRRTEALRQRFGPEYDRTLSTTGKVSGKNVWPGSRCATFRLTRLSASPPHGRTCRRASWTIHARPCSKPIG